MNLYGHAVVLLEDPSEEDWLNARHHGIGGSDVAAVLGMSPYSNNVEVWARKTGRADRDIEPNEAMDLGHLFEEVIAQATAERLGLEILGPPHPVLLQHPDLPYLLVTPDRIARDKDGRVGPLEIKMTAGPTVSDDWSDDATPHAAALQLVHQMVVTGHQVGWIGALVGGYGHRIEPRTIEWDQGLADVLVAALSEFWQHVEEEKMPAPLGAGASKSVEDVFSALGVVGRMEIDTDTIALVDQLADARERASTAKKEAEQLAAQVGARLHDADTQVGLVDGCDYVTWKAHEETRVVPALVKEAFPDTWERFAETKPRRVLRTPRKGAA